jgi:WD40 repeat protein
MTSAINHSNSTTTMVLQDPLVLQMPSDITTQIFTRLSAQDIGASALVCKKWNQVIKDDRIWRVLFDKYFPSVDPSTIKDFKNFQDAYQTLYSNLNKGVYASYTFQGHKNRITSLAVIGKNLCSGSDDRTIKVWDIKTEECIATLKGHKDKITSLAVIGENLCSGSSDRTIKIWDIKTEECIATLEEGHKNQITSLAVIGENLCSGSNDRTIKIWDIKTEECIATLEGHEHWVTSLAVIGKNLCSGSSDSTIRVWDIQTKECIATLKGHEWKITSLAVIGETLYSASDDSTIKVWNIQTEKCIATLNQDQFGSWERIYSLASIGGRKLFSGFYEAIKIWDIETGECTGTFERERGDPAFYLASAGGRLFSNLGGHNSIQALDFTANHSTVFQEIVALLKTGTREATQQAIERFSGMPTTAKNAIYKKLHEICKPFNNDYNRNCAEDAFYNRNGQSSTPAEKAQAIQNYLEDDS